MAAAVAAATHPEDIDKALLGGDSFIGNPFAIIFCNFILPLSIYLWLLSLSLSFSLSLSLGICDGCQACSSGDHFLFKFLTTVMHYVCVFIIHLIFINLYF